MIYERNCPNCGDIIEYTNKRSWYNAKNRKSKCKSCTSKQLSEIAKKKVESGEDWGGKRNAEKEKNINKPFKRVCPNCNEIMGYTSKYARDRAERNDVMCNRCSAIVYKKGIAFRESTDEEIKKMRASKAGFDDWEEYVEKYPEKQFYKREVWKYTYRNDLESLPNWDKRGRCGVDGAYQLDHITSINEGYESGMPAEKVGGVDNLRMIPWEENRAKW